MRIILLVLVFMLVGCRSSNVAPQRTIVEYVPLDPVVERNLEQERILLASLKVAIVGGTDFDQQVLACAEEDFSGKVLPDSFVCNHGEFVVRFFDDKSSITLPSVEYQTVLRNLMIKSFGFEPEIFDVGSRKFNVWFAKDMIVAMGLSDDNNLVVVIDHEIRNNHE